MERPPDSEAFAFHSCYVRQQDGINRSATVQATERRIIERLAPLEPSTGPGVRVAPHRVRVRLLRIARPSERQRTAAPEHLARQRGSATRKSAASPTNSGTRSEPSHESGHASAGRGHLIQPDSALIDAVRWIDACCERVIRCPAS